MPRKSHLWCLAPGWPQLRSGLRFGPRSQASLQKAQVAFSSQNHEHRLPLEVDQPESLKRPRCTPPGGGGFLSLCVGKAQRNSSSTQFLAMLTSLATVHWFSTKPTFFSQIEKLLSAQGRHVLWAQKGKVFQGIICSATLCAQLV